ncbi:serine hydrolase [Pleionea sp. CnH1-48]|uniref:serine hydrolase domain-containing protein n=1 Tax=Pleionea sp. CnH1-48 TaxID=2954494 RepID=UPI002097215B|nr:serine hydrolase [Pleionea sp. CnH1-48]MCO7224387.1 serine hydrolase [Pleionea sp. CnH1-48]
MTIHVSVRKSISCLALSALGVLSTDSLSKNYSVAPEATAAEAKASFKDIPSLKEAFISPKPAAKKDGIAVGKLGVDGGNKRKIIELAKEIADNKHGRYDSLLIAHKGKLLFESYYLRGRVNLPHFQASSTKGYLSLAVGRAIQLGYLTMADLDKPLISFLKELDTSKLTKGAEKITLHNAMIMSSGVGLSREKMNELDKQPAQLKGQKQVQTYLELSPPISSESQSYNYKPADPKLVMQVLEAVVPGSAKDFIKKELLDKLEITNYQWMDDVSGLPMGPYGAKMISRDMLKFGTLAMNKGKWKGEQLIPVDYITKATNRLIDVEEIFFVNKNVSNPGYGYYWWLADLEVGNKTYLSQSAQGGGGQYIILVEELDLIVVVTGHSRELRPLQVTAEKILPAFIK